MTILFLKLLCDTTAHVSLSSLFHFLTQLTHRYLQTKLSLSPDLMTLCGLLLMELSNAMVLA